MVKLKDLGAAQLSANGLLLALPEKERRSILGKLQLASLRAGQVLFKPGKVDCVYFPVSAIVAKLVEMADGLKVGAGLIGKEGVVPLWCFFSRLDATPYRVEVQHPGQALRMSAEDFKAEMEPGQSLHGIVTRYYAAFAAQVLQATACNRLHNIVQQYCRWLLMTHDRVGVDEFELKQETVARMLGVRRMSVTAAARHLRTLGVIDYSRGSLCILDRPGLEQASCECYRRTKEIFHAILPPPL